MEVPLPSDAGKPVVLPPAGLSLPQAHGSPHSGCHSFSLSLSELKIAKVILSDGVLKGFGGWRVTKCHKDHD